MHTTNSVFSRIVVEEIIIRRTYSYRLLLSIQACRTNAHTPVIGSLKNRSVRAESYEANAHCEACADLASTNREQIERSLGGQVLMQAHVIRSLLPSLVDHTYTHCSLLADNSLSFRKSSERGLPPIIYQEYYYHGGILTPNCPKKKDVFFFS